MIFCAFAVVLPPSPTPTLTLDQRRSKNFLVMEWKQIPIVLFLRHSWLRIPSSIPSNRKAALKRRGTERWVCLGSTKVPKLCRKLWIIHQDSSVYFVDTGVWKIKKTGVLPSVYYWKPAVNRLLVFLVTDIIPYIVKPISVWGVVLQQQNETPVID